MELTGIKDIDNIIIDYKVKFEEVDRFNKIILDVIKNIRYRRRKQMIINTLIFFSFFLFKLYVILIYVYLSLVMIFICISFLT